MALNSAFVISRPIQRFGIAERSVWHCVVRSSINDAIALSRDVTSYDLTTGAATVMRSNVDLAGVAPQPRDDVLLAWTDREIIRLAGPSSPPDISLPGPAMIHAATFLRATNGYVALVRRNGDEENLQLLADGVLAFTAVSEPAETLWIRGVGAWSVACGRRDGGVHVWHFPDGGTPPRRIELQEHSGAVLRGTASDGGSYLATAGKDLTIRVYRIEEEPQLGARPVATLPGHTGEITDLIFIPDARALVSCSRDRIIRIWSLPDGRLLKSIVDHRDWVTHVAVSPDGTRLASCCEDGTIKVWDLETFECIDTAYGTSPFLTIAMSADTICAGDAAGNFWILEYGVPAPGTQGTSEVARRYVVRGRVAGVGFRQFAEKAAANLGVRGQVRNRPDGAIEVLVVGSSQQHAEMKEALSKGPPSAQVTTVEEESVPPGDVQGFSAQ